MKKILLAILILGAALGCAKKETPASSQPAAVAPASVPAPAAIPELPEKMVNEAASSMQEVADALEKPVTVASVTSAAQSSTQETVRQGDAIVDGVTSSVQSATQDLIREGGAIVGGVTSAAQISAQDAARAQSSVAGSIASAAQSSSQEAASGEGSVPVEEALPT